MRRHLLLCLLGALLALPAIGCSKHKETPTQPGNATQTIEEANQILEDLLFAMLNSPTAPGRPSDVDLTAAYNKFQEALRQDPTNPTANFGVGVLGMMSLTQDPEVNAAFDEWKAYIDSRKVPFEVPTGGTPALGVPLGLSYGTGAVHLPLDLGPATVAALARPTLVAADPQLGQAQAILRARALPRLVEAVARLDVVAGKPRFTYTVTSRMQGDESEPPVEIDHTDVLALRAACQLLAALCDLAVAYDLNFAAYDSTTLVRNLSRGSSWMRLTPDGAGRMADAQYRLTQASIGVDSTIVSLLAETDDQSDDVIKASPDPAERAQLAAMHADLLAFRTAINGRWTRTEDWDSNPYTPPVALTFDLGHFFQQPVYDWKEILPAYTVSTERRAYSENFQYDYGYESIEVTVAASSYYYASVSLYVQPGSSGPDTSWYEYGDPGLVNAFRERALQVMSVIAATPGWTGEAGVYLSFSGNLVAGTQVASAYRNSWWNTAATSVFVPVITWDALTFQAWTWPDPSIGGLLPDLVSTAQLESVFGITADHWSRRNVLDWTGSSYVVAFRGPRLQ